MTTPMKPVRAWAVFHPYLDFPVSLDPLRSVAFAEALKWYGGKSTWAKMRKRGYSCRKITITEGWPKEGKK